MATKKIAFTLELEGSTKITKQLTEVELDLGAVGKQISQVKKDIDTFNRGTEEQRAALEASGKSLKSLGQDYQRLRTQQIGLQEERKTLNREIRDQVKAFKEAENAVPTDSLIGLRRQYKELRKEINLLSAEERESDFGDALIKNAAKIKQEILDIGESVNDGREGVGLYKKALQDFFGSAGGQGGALANVLGDVLGGGGTGGGLSGSISSATSALGPYGIAIGAAAAATQVLGTYIVDVTKEFEQLNNQVGTLTGTTGEQLTKLTVDIKTVAEVFDQDFNEVLRATNALTKEVTGDFDESIGLIEKAFLAGGNASGQLLDNLIEYSAQIGAAGASGEEFVEILVRAEREGIFSDKGIDLVKEFGLRIREQTTATGKALQDAFGEQFTTELFDGINDGSVNTVDALTKVSDAIKTNQLTAKQSQQLLADVFGGPGEDAGLRFIEILGDIDGDLSDLIDTTDAYTQRQYASLEATRELNEEQQILGAQFAGMTFDLDTLTTRVQAFGTSLINDVLLNVRAIGKEFKEGNFAEGLRAAGTETIAAILPGAGALIELFGGTVGARQEAVDEIVKQDAEALREIKEGEEAAAAARRQAAIDGTANLQTLRQEQNLLKQEIDAARVAGEDYSGLQEDLTKVTNNLAKATGIFNTNVRRTKENFEEVAADGSIKQLTDEVRELQKQVSEAEPNEALKLIEELNNAQLDLSVAQARIEAFKESVRRANLDALPIEEQIKIEQESIDKRRELAIQAATQRTEDEKLLQAQLSAIREEYTTISLENELRQYEEGSAEYIRITNEIAESQSNLLKINDEVGDELVRVLIDFDERLKSIDQEALKNVLVPEFDPNDIAGSLEAIKEFEEQKSIVQAEAQLQRLELQRELAEQQGESTLELERQIAEQTLTIEQQKNAQLIEESQKRAEKQAELASKIAETEQQAFKAIGESLGNFLVSSAEDGEEAFKKLGEGILSTVIDLLAQQATLLVSQAFAQPDSVATFGASGAARVAIITGLIQGASSAIKGILTANLSEDGNILDGGSLRTGGIFKGNLHKDGGVKFLLNTAYGHQLQEAEKDESIINRASTSKWKGLLSAINVDGGGRSFAPDTGAYLRILRDFKPTKYATGGQIGSAANIPMLVNPQSVSSGLMQARVSSEDMAVLSDRVAERFAEANIEAVSRIVSQVVAGLDESNRLKEREALASKNAQV